MGIEINLKSDTLDKAVDKVSDFIKPLIQPAITDIGEVLADKTKVWRLKNQIKNLKKVEEIVKNNNLTLKQIDMKVLFPYLEAVSLEEDEDLQDMWANLFVNYIDASKNLKTIVYPQILKQLSTNEVQILNRTYSESGIEALEIIQNKIESEISNLYRLGLISERFYKENRSERYFINHNLSPKNLYITDFGKYFLEACTR